MEEAFAGFEADDGHAVEDDVGRKFADQKTDGVGVDVLRYPEHQERAYKEAVEQFGGQKFYQQVGAGGGDNHGKPFEPRVFAVAGVVRYKFERDEIAVKADALGDPSGRSCRRV